MRSTPLGQELRVRLPRRRSVGPINRLSWSSNSLVRFEPREPYVSLEGPLQPRDERWELLPSYIDRRWLGKNHRHAHRWWKSVHKPRQDQLRTDPRGDPICRSSQESGQPTPRPDRRKVLHARRAASHRAVCSPRGLRVRESNYHPPKLIQHDESVPPLKPAREPERVGMPTRRHRCHEERTECAFSSSGNTTTQGPSSGSRGRESDRGLSNRRHLGRGRLLPRPLRLIELCWLGVIQESVRAPLPHKPSGIGPPGAMRRSALNDEARLYNPELNFVFESSLRRPRPQAAQGQGKRRPRYPSGARICDPTPPSPTPPTPPSRDQPCGLRRRNIQRVRATNPGARRGKDGRS